MSSTIKLWCFILLLPFFAAIGHDFYANYLADNQKKTKLEAFEIDPASYQISDLGYLFVTYTPDLFDAAREQVGEETWKKYADPVLRQYTFVIALVPAAIFYAYLFIARLFGLYPFGGTFKQKRTDSEDMFKKRDIESKFKYKRR